MDNRRISIIFHTLRLALYYLDIYSVTASCKFLIIFCCIFRDLNFFTHYFLIMYTVTYLFNHVLPEMLKKLFRSSLASPTKSKVTPFRKTTNHCDLCYLKHVVVLAKTYFMMLTIDNTCRLFLSKEYVLSLLITDNFTISAT